MKRRRWIADFFSKLGAALIITAVIISFSMQSSPLKLVGSMDSACEQITLFMEAIRCGDHVAVNQSLLTDYQSEENQMPSNDLSRVVRKAYMDSITYEFIGECYASDTALCQNIAVTVLDVPTVLHDLIENYQRTYGVKVTSDENNNLIIISNDGSIQEFFSTVTNEFVEKFLEKNSSFRIMNLTLELVYRRGHWKILFNEDVLDLLTGGINA